VSNPLNPTPAALAAATVCDEAEKATEQPYNPGPGNSLAERAAACNLTAEERAKVTGVMTLTLFYGAEGTLCQACDSNQAEIDPSNPVHLAAWALYAHFTQVVGLAHQLAMAQTLERVKANVEATTGIVAPTTPIYGPDGGKLN